MEKPKGSGFLRFLSGVYLAAALVLLVVVCTNCCPAAEQAVKAAAAGLEDSPVREAFAVLTDNLRQGTPLNECFAETAAVLFDEAV